MGQVDSSHYISLVANWPIMNCLWQARDETLVDGKFPWQILAGRHLFKAGRGIPSPFVEVEILGAYYEDTKKFKTKTKGKRFIAA